MIEKINFSCSEAKEKLDVSYRENTNSAKLESNAEIKIIDDNGKKVVFVDNVKNCLI